MLRNRNLIVLTLVLGLTVPVSCGGSAANSSTTASSAPVTVGHQLLAPAAADALLHSPPAGLVTLDVRTPDEFAAGHITGAVDLDLNAATFGAGVAELDPNAPYFVYCHSGNRSAQAVTYMQQQGFTSIYELQGGISAWQAAGLPVVAG